MDLEKKPTKVFRLGGTNQDNFSLKFEPKVFKSPFVLKVIGILNTLDFFKSCKKF